MQHTVRKTKAGQVDPRGLANMALGAARCGRSGMPGILVAALATATERRLTLFNPQNVANTAWAFATANSRDEKLFAALARAAERLLQREHFITVFHDYFFSPFCLFSFFLFLASFVFVWLLVCLFVGGFAFLLFCWFVL